ncbi:MAG: DUF1464 family protein [Promethearchaeota archaeon]
MGDSSIRCLGVDPGSKSWDFVGYDDEEDDETGIGAGIFLDHSVPTKRIQKNPEIFMTILRNSGPFELISAPSGFGLPLKKLVDLTDKDFFLTILKKKNENSEDKGSIVGLTSILKLLQRENVNGYLLPGVKHLHTVKRFRKVNKIDLGTADKLCTAVIGIRNQMEDFGITCKDSSFIMVELGYAFSAVLAVEHGQIIDGIGGSNIVGFRAVGSIDAEIAYLMGKIKKKHVYKGGVSSITGYSDMNAEEIVLLSKKDERTNMALDAFYDGLTKAIYAISSSFSEPEKIREILFAGRLSKLEPLVNPLFEKVNKIAPTKVMRSYAQVSKESAQGAAFIANGILGGKFKDIVDNLKIKEASGSILDDIFLPLEQDINFG